MPKREDASCPLLTPTIRGKPTARIHKKASNLQRQMEVFMAAENQVKSPGASGSVCRKKSLLLC
jgi:hypothetical protein